MRKRIFMLLCGVALLCILFVQVLPAALAADVTDSKCDGNPTWTLDSDGLLTVFRTENMHNYGFDDPWGQYKSTIKTVLIGSGVMRIGENAFNDCTGLTNECLSLKLKEKSVQEIDFSHEPSEEEKTTMIDYYQNESAIIFNETYAKQLYMRDQAMIAMKTDSAKETEFCKEYADSNAVEICATNNALGTYGDILVSYSFSSLGMNIGVPGHAAIVSTISSQTVESYPKSAGHANGVRYYTNNWKSKSKVYGIRVRGANHKQYTNAAKYAMMQADARKPYNWNFFNKGTTEKFYCSQLVWRAWKNQGFEVDRMNLGNWEPVSPAELVGGSSTYVFYYK